MLIWLLPTAAILFAAGAASRQIIKRALHIFQLEDYEAGRAEKIILKHPQLIMPPVHWMAAALFLAIAVIRLVWIKPNTAQSLGMAALAIAAYAVNALFVAKTIRKVLHSAKKPLVMTARARRIYAVSTVLTVVYLQFIIRLTGTLKGMQCPLLDFSLTGEPGAFPMDGLLWAILLALSLNNLTSWLSVAGAVLILKPYESNNQRRYLAEARAILTEFKPMVIGVTGSYGKTGTKELLAAMLAEKYNVFKPPGSYNTLMGVTRIVREALRPYHQLLVVEMGAYRIGTIAKLCDLTRPTHGIITVIGVQHLERFKSRETIQRAKGELARALPSDGFLVLNADDPLCREIGTWHKGEVIYFSIGSGPSNLQADSYAEVRDRRVSALNIRIGITGSEFDLRFPDGEVLSVRLSLLGRGAVANATAAAALAERLGVTRREIRRVLAQLPQVPHRLELKTGRGGVRIIDDAYNSNPVGAAAALEVLSQAQGGRRILVTPGMIELGGIEDRANFEFGRQAAAACDMAVLVGSERIAPIENGLLDAGFSRRSIHKFKTLKAAMDYLYLQLEAGDTILLENDLPDQYTGW